MTSSYFRYPIDPLVAENPFRVAPPTAVSMPTFAEAQPRLPVPILPDQPRWVRMYWRAWEMVWSKLIPPAADNKLTVPVIDPSYNGNVFLWDTAFLSQIALYARRTGVPWIGLDNFYARQHDDGFICREFNPQTGYDLFYPFDPNGTGPTILGWAEWRLFRQLGDVERLTAVFNPLVAYHRWCRTQRTWPSGLYWATGMSSHMDNQPRVPDSNRHHRHWTWIDASMQGVVDCIALEKMALVLQKPEFATEFSQEKERLIEQINRHLWSEEAKFFLDTDPNGRFSQVKSIGAYWGLLSRQIIPEVRRLALIQHLREPWSFNLPHRIPSQSADSIGYNAETGNYWRGGVWPTATYMVLKGLRQVGQQKLMAEIARNHLENVHQVFEQTGTFWENYAPESAHFGSPARPDFTGTSALTPIAILLEHIIGLTVDWPQSRVYWDKRLETTAAYGVENYPVGPQGTMSLTGDASQVTVTTDVPFTLVVRDGSLNVQTAVPAGTTTIELD